MSRPYQIALAAQTDVGQYRQHNEDRYLLSGHGWSGHNNEYFSPGPDGALMVVADGMGGMEAGEIASHLAIRFIQDYYENLEDWSPPIEPLLREALTGAHNLIVQNAQLHPEREGMGTTAILAWILGNTAHLLWSGDSRAYAFRPETGLELLTEDHSLVWDMVKKGSLSPEEARLHPDSNVITQSLGALDYPPKPDFRSIALRPNEQLLLCSDGLNSMLPDQQIEKILRQKHADLSATCKALIFAANVAGGDDNITVALLHLKS
jgi:serine/threonine protein phosphatase PrpC